MKMVLAFYIGGPKCGQRVNRHHMRSEKIDVTENVHPQFPLDFSQMGKMPSISRIQQHVACYEKSMWGNSEALYVFFVLKGTDNVKEKCEQLLKTKGWI